MKCMLISDEHIDIRTEEAGARFRRMREGLQ